MNVRVCGVLTQNDSILLIRHDYSEGQLWHIPGGNVGQYETLNEALQREFYEELAITVRVRALWLVCDAIRPDKVHVLHCVFITELLHGEPSIQPESTSGVFCKWVLFEDAKSLKLYPNISLHLEELKRKNHGNLSTRYLGRC